MKPDCAETWWNGAPRGAGHYGANCAKSPNYKSLHSGYQMRVDLNETWHVGVWGPNLSTLWSTILWHNFITIFASYAVGCGRILTKVIEIDSYHSQLSYIKSFMPAHNLQNFAQSVVNEARLCWNLVKWCSKGCRSLWCKLCKIALYKSLHSRYEMKADCHEIWHVGVPGPVLTTLWSTILWHNFFSIFASHVASSERIGTKLMECILYHSAQTCIKKILP